MPFQISDTQTRSQEGLLKLLSRSATAYSTADTIFLPVLILVISGTPHPAHTNYFQQRYGGCIDDNAQEPPLSLLRRAQQNRAGLARLREPDNERFAKYLKIDQACDASCSFEAYQRKIAATPFTVLSRPTAADIHQNEMIHGDYLQRASAGAAPFLPGALPGALPGPFAGPLALPLAGDGGACSASTTDNARAISITG